MTKPDKRECLSVPNFFHARLIYTNTSGENPNGAHTQWVGSWGLIHNIAFSLYLMNGHNNLVFHNTMMERLAKDKHSSFLVSFVSYKEIEVL
jgi:hypothetical protein